MSSKIARLALPIRALALTVAPAAICLAPPAIARTKAGLGLGASATVSTSPDLTGNAETGVSGTVVATPWLRIEDDVSRVGLLGSIQLEKFAHRYGSNVSGWASLDANRRLSQYVTIGGGLTYRRSNRILDDFLARGGAGGTIGGDGSGGVVLPTNPLPDVSIGSVRTRNESYEGNANMSVLTSARGQMSLGAGIRAARYNSLSASNLNTYSAFMGYSHSLSERTSLTTDVSFARYDFLGIRSGDGWTVSPHVGASQKLGETLTLTGSIGASLSRSRRPDGSIRSFTVLSGEVSLCKSAERIKYCLSADRTAETAVLGGATASSKVKFNLATSIGERSALSADVFYARYDSPTVATVGRVSDFVGASASFTRTFPGRRLSAFASPSFIRLKDNNGARTNFQVQFGLRYSFGART